MAAQSSDQFANTLFDLITGHRLTAVIYVAAQLRICDLLAEGRKWAHLAAGSERSLKAWVLVVGDMLRAAWAQLIESVRSWKN
jgi:hypothetical protein